MKCSLGMSNFLEEISSLSHSVVFLYFFALITEEGFLISPCYSLELCIQMGTSFLFHVLTIVDSAVMNIVVHVSFSIMVSLGYMPSSGIVRPYGSFLPHFLRNLHTGLHSVLFVTLLYDHSYSVHLSR